MNPRLGLLRRLSNSDAILPPPSEMEEVKIPEPPIVPVIKEPTKEELEKEEFEQKIWNELRHRLMKDRHFEDALDEIKWFLKNRELTRPTEPAPSIREDKITEHYVPPSERPTLLNVKQSANELLKLCSNFYRLCIK